jgi:hypothetical protein
VPTAVDIGGIPLRTDPEVASARLSDLVRAPLAAGRAEGVRALLVAAVKDSILDKATPTATSSFATMLKLLSLAMMGIYILWITTRRIQALAKAPKGAPPLQRGVSQRLVVLGVCLALLLANPLRSPTAEMLAESSLAAARIGPVNTPVLDKRIAQGIAGQSRLLIEGTMGRDLVARNGIAELSANFATSLQRWQALDSSTRAGAGADASRLAADAARFEVIARVLDSLGRRSLLLVISGSGVPFSVARSRIVVARGTGAGLYWVSPGQYVLLDATGRAWQSTNVTAGQHVAVLQSVPLRGGGAGSTVVPRGPIVE